VRLSRAQLAAKLKLNAPYAHTFLEIIGKRWGTLAHVVFMVFGCVPQLVLGVRFASYARDRLATNIIVSSMLILGGSATVTSLTGMSTIAVRGHPVGRMRTLTARTTGMLSDPRDRRGLRYGRRDAVDDPLRLVRSPDGLL
jgi:undecaprenyl pyrophosphate phosphatase UppP